MPNRRAKIRAAVVGLGWPGMQHLKGYTIDSAFGSYCRLRFR